MIIRNDLLDKKSPEGIEVVQLTNEAVPSCHIYMEAQIFTPDSKRFLLHRFATTHGVVAHREHRYLVCDIENQCKLTPVIDEYGAIAPSVTPDGNYVYYLIDESTIGGKRVILKRVCIDGTGRETVTVIDPVLPGTDFRPCSVYPLSTISSDGKRLAVSASLRKKEAPVAACGLMVFDLEAGSVELVLHDNNWANMHSQYSRSLDPEQSHDILVQQNHNADTLGADIHVIRDDGTDFRDLPWGRDGVELCQGHQCWHGRSNWAITGTTHCKTGKSDDLIESRAMPHAGHIGAGIPGGARNNLTRECRHPSFMHFGTDIAGKRLITDAKVMDAKDKASGRYVMLGNLGEPGTDPITNFHYLVNAHVRSLGKLDIPPGGKLHLHPFLSPDGTMGFFNSDESGIVNAYMIRGL